jgi:hypothetical protein
VRHASSELRDLMVRYWAAFTRGDGSFVEAHLSADPGVLGVGTDPCEWYEGAEVRRVFTEHLPAVAGVSIIPGEVGAYQEGPVGWIPDRPTFTFPDGTTFSVRFTAVAHREDGEWKLVQAHTSVGVPNEQVVGQDLPT